MAALRGGKRRGTVLLLLLASVLAPIVLYIHIPNSPSSDSILARSAFDREDASNLIARNEVRDFDVSYAHPEDSFDVVKEPVQMVASHVSLAKDITIGTLGEHKNRVLSATDDWQVVEVASESHASEQSNARAEREEVGFQNAKAEVRDEVVIEGHGSAQSGQDGVIVEVVRRESSAHGFGETGDNIKEAEMQDGEEMKKVELQHTDELEHKDEMVIVGNDGTQLGQDGAIKQVIDGENIIDRSIEMESKDGRAQNGEEMEEAESQDASEVEHKVKLIIAAKGGIHSEKVSGIRNEESGEAGDNNIVGMHTNGNLKFSLKKESSVESSEQTEHATSKESNTRGSATSKDTDSRASNSNSGYSTTEQDATIRIIKDQLIRARTYLGFVASRGNHGFVKELRARMRDIQRALADATSDGQLPENVKSKIRAMEQALVKVKQYHDNCASVISRLRATLHSTERQIRAQKRAANNLSQIAAKAMPKGLHCLPLRLTNEYYSSSSNPKDFPYKEKLEDPKLYHYALFSDNVLAAAVVVNSTLVHAKKPANHVFHIVTDRLNYAAMKAWFLANPSGKAAIQVQNIEEFTWLNSSYSPVLKQLESQSMIDFYFRTEQGRLDENPKFRNPKYLSILNHLRFYLPEIYPKLNKILFLDDDTVVQQDLSALWSIDLKGKVNGAVETCGETFHRFDKYLNFSNPLIANNFAPNACAWAYGMNMFDLAEWRKQNITDVYHSWQKLNEGRLLWKLGTLPAGLVTFWNRTFPLDRSWHLLGLGYNPNVHKKDIERAPVIHYNGNLKPWLEIGLPKYRQYWSRHVNFNQVFLRECNINP